MLGRLAKMGQVRNGEWTKRSERKAERMGSKAHASIIEEYSKIEEYSHTAPSSALLATTTTIYSTEYLLIGQPRGCSRKVTQDGQANCQAKTREDGETGRGPTQQKLQLPNQHRDPRPSAAGIRRRGENPVGRSSTKYCSRQCRKISRSHE